MLTPVNEADRVAPVALTLLAEPVFTMVFSPPEVPPPDGFHLETFLKRTALVPVADEYQRKPLVPFSLSFQEVLA